MKVVQIVVVVLFVALSISEGKKYKEGDCEGMLPRPRASDARATVCVRVPIGLTCVQSLYCPSSLSSMRDVPERPTHPNEGEWGGQFRLERGREGAREDVRDGKK